MDLRGISMKLTVEMVEANYRRGIFPMSDPGSPVITWHRPARRALIPLEGFHISRSLSRTLRRGNFEVTFDRAFLDVMRGCAERPEGTWISERFFEVYGELHRLGKAHSVEVWMGGGLVGGVYGVHLGGAFFAESKFHRETDMSKVALTHLVRRLRERGFMLLEVQYLTRHLAQFGTVTTPNRVYMRLLTDALALDCSFV
jgi:leucyl/phenylalanyl-tRNA---protein transferase